MNHGYIFNDQAFDFFLITMVIYNNEVFDVFGGRDIKL